MFYSTYFFRIFFFQFCCLQKNKNKQKTISEIANLIIDVNQILSICLGTDQGTATISCSRVSGRFAIYWTELLGFFHCKIYSQCLFHKVSEPLWIKQAKSVRHEEVAWQNGWMLYVCNVSRAVNVSMEFVWVFSFG